MEGDRLDEINEIKLTRTDGSILSIRCSHDDVLLFNEARALGETYREAGYELALVGGPVRDLLLGGTPKDLDMASNAKPGKTSQILRQWGEDYWEVGRKYGTIGARKTINDDLTATVEVTTYRKDSYDHKTRKPQVEWGTSLEEDLSRRDFTMNAIAIRLPEMVLVDPFDGARDLIERKIIRTPQGAIVSFSDDPLRMMRAIRFQAKLGLELGHEEEAAISKMASRLEIVSAERVRDELTKIMLSDDPVIGLREMLTTGLLHYVLPEVEALAEMDKSSQGRHKKTFEHTMRVIERAMTLEGSNGYEEITKPDLTLRLAALLHDIGKPVTRKFNGRKPVTFDGHEKIGAKMARECLSRLKFDKRLVDDVTQLVRQHMRFHGYADSGMNVNWTDSAVRRYVRESGHLYLRLNMLTRADNTTRHPDRERRFSQMMDAMEARVIELKRKEDLDAIRPELNGNEIMAILGLEQGKEVGAAMRHMLDYRLEHGLVGHDAAVAELERWADSK